MSIGPILEAWYRWPFGVCHVGGEVVKVDEPSS